jgi:LysR family transcriptional activator of nhaA
MVNLNVLSSFYVCAEHLSFSKAAAILGISQPSLSIQIKNLEEQMGARLFLRNGKSISLTTKGRALQKSAALFSELTNEVDKCMDKSPDSEPQSSIRILVTDEVERPFVAEIVSKLAKKEKVRMAIFSSSTEDALSITENSETDILLSHEKVNSTWNHEKIDFPVYFVTSSKLPNSPTFDQHANIQKVVDYFGEDLIIPSIDIKLGREFQSFKRKHGLKKEVILESNIVSCLVRFVASGAESVGE